MIRLCVPVVNVVGRLTDTILTVRLLIGVLLAVPKRFVPPFRAVNNISMMALRLNVPVKRFLRLGRQGLILFLPRLVRGGMGLLLLVSKSWRKFRQVRLVLDGKHV
jgi:hypothetical protein